MKVMFDNIRAYWNLASWMKKLRKLEVVHILKVFFERIFELRQKSTDVSKVPNRTAGIMTSICGFIQLHIIATERPWTCFA